MPSLIFVTQIIDPDDPVLGFVVPQLRVLGERCELRVVANEVRDPRALQGVAEVVSLGKEQGHGRVRRTLRYLRILRRWTGGARPDAIFVHMCAEYVIAGAPVARARSVPVLFWFAHPAYHAGVRTAERLADVILTSLPGAYPNPDANPVAIGQAIDVGRFHLAGPVPPGSLRVAVIGRTSEAKAFGVAVAAVAQCRAAGVDVHLRIIGTTTTEPERRYREHLAGLIAELGLNDAVTLEPGRPQHELPDVLDAVHALVNCTVAGTADKVVFEAMASGRAVLVSNPVFRPLLADMPVELTFEEGDATGLAARLMDLAAARDQLGAVGPVLRERVATGHSIEHWAASVSDVVAGLGARARG